MFRPPQVQRFVLAPKWSIMRSMSPTNRYGGAKILFQFDMLVISKAANADSYTPEGSCAAAKIGSSPNRKEFSDPIGKQFLVQRRLQKRNQATVRLPR